MKKQITCVMLSTVLFAGCATDRGQTQAEGTGAGAVIGALTGALVGYAAGGQKGALIGATAGAGVGAGAGYAYGTHVANQKEKFAKEEDYLDAVIVSAHQMNEQTQQYNASLRSEVDTLDRQTASLVQQYNQKTVQKGTLQKEEQRLATKISEAQKQLQKVSNEVEIQRRVLAQEQGQTVSGASEKAADTGHGIRATKSGAGTAYQQVGLDKNQGSGIRHHVCIIKQ